MQLLKQVSDLILRSEKILILPSSPPDGDSIGAAIALYLALKKLKKETTVVCKENIPELLKFLPNIDAIGDKMSSSSDFIISLDLSKAKVSNIKSTVEENKVNIIITPSEGRFAEEDVTFNKGNIDYDLIITVDCAELSQLGDVYEKNIELFHQLPVINIDHHISNAHFGKINFVDIMASSTTELILSILEEMAKEQNIDIIDEDIATLLLTGIITDTGSFQNANTTPRSFAKSAQLIAYGARQQEIIQHIYKTKHLSQLKLWGRILSKIQTDNLYKIVWSTVSEQDFVDTDSREDQIGDLIDELMTNAPGAEVVLLIKEKEPDLISVSVRTTSPAVDASKIAENFSGGGHVRAAGFKMKNIKLRDAEYKVIDYVKSIQAERLGITEEEKSQEESSEPVLDVEEIIKRADAQQSEASQKKQPTPPKKKTRRKKSQKSSKKSEKSLELKTPQTEETSKDLSYRFED